MPASTGEPQNAQAKSFFIFISAKQTGHRYDFFSPETGPHPRQWRGKRMSRIRLFNSPTVYNWNIFCGIIIEEACNVQV